ncbi:MAG: GerMN domain-containing protein [Lawsonibacter sp.]|jgi:hypothetical protein
MKPRSMVLFFAFLVALLTGCGGNKKVDTGYQLYFLADTSSTHGAALGTEPYAPAGKGTTNASGSENPTPGKLLQALLEGPKTEGLTTPFPKGVTYQWWVWDEETPGNLRVGLSEQYGGLTDISLTLADYCIVLTLSQIEGVETVEIVSEGHTSNYRSHDLLQAEEAILSDAVSGMGAGTT